MIWGIIVAVTGKEYKPFFALLMDNKVPPNCTLFFFLDTLNKTQERTQAYSSNFSGLHKISPYPILSFSSVKQH